MGCQVHVIRKAIRPLFAYLVTYYDDSLLCSRESRIDDASHYRESFLEVMDEVEDWLRAMIMWTMTSMDYNIMGHTYPPLVYCTFLQHFKDIFLIYNILWIALLCLSRQNVVKQHHNQTPFYFFMVSAFWKCWFLVCVIFSFASNLLININNHCSGSCRLVHMYTSHCLCELSLLKLPCSSPFSFWPVHIWFAHTWSAHNFLDGFIGILTHDFFSTYVVECFKSILLTLKTSPQVDLQLLRLNRLIIC